MGAYAETGWRPKVATLRFTFSLIFLSSGRNRMPDKFSGNSRINLFTVTVINSKRMENDWKHLASH